MAGDQEESSNPASIQPAAGSPSTHFHVMSIGRNRGGPSLGISVIFPITPAGVSGVLVRRRARTLSFSLRRSSGRANVPYFAVKSGLLPAWTLPISAPLRNSVAASSAANTAQASFSSPTSGTSKIFRKLNMASGAVSCPRLASGREDICQQRRRSCTVAGSGSAAVAKEMQKIEASAMRGEYFMGRKLKGKLTL